MAGPEQSGADDPANVSFPDNRELVEAAKGGQAAGPNSAPRPEDAGRVMDQNAAHYIAEGKNNFLDSAAEAQQRADDARARAKQAYAAGEVTTYGQELNVARASQKETGRQTRLADTAEQGRQQVVDSLGGKAPAPRVENSEEDDNLAAAA